MRNDRRSKTDRAVVADCHVGRVQFVNVNELADPDVFSNRHSAHSLEPRSQTESPGGEESDLPRKPAQ